MTSIAVISADEHELPVLYPEDLSDSQAAVPDAVRAVPDQSPDEELAVSEWPKPVG